MKLQNEVFVIICAGKELAAQPDRRGVPPHHSDGHPAPLHQAARQTQGVSSPDHGNLYSIPQSALSTGIAYFSNVSSLSSRV
jgi:uncharacterized lipoprotein